MLQPRVHPRRRRHRVRIAARLEARPARPHPRAPSRRRSIRVPLAIRWRSIDRRRVPLWPDCSSGNSSGGQTILSVRTGRIACPPLRRTLPRRRIRIARAQARAQQGTGDRMKRLLALTWKEFLQLKRDKMTLKMIVMVPVLQTLIFGYAINYDVKHLKTIVLDESRTFESRELVAKMTGTDYFDVVQYVDSMDAMRTEIDAGRAAVGL